MMTGNFLHCCKRLILSMLILAFSCTVLLSQKLLSGDLNLPSTHVSSISALNRVVVDNNAGFSKGDTVLLIQMQGVKILTGPAGSYGGIQDKFGEPGMYEFLIISDIIGTTDIVFSRNLLSSYDVRGNIQVVAVPSYRNAKIIGNITTGSWDKSTKSGGVLAMIIGQKLELAADIDMSGAGFRGGLSSVGAGICWNTNTTLYNQEYYDATFTNAGFKGEGIAIHSDAGILLDPFAAKGLGRNVTGGGGGDGRYSGGGGGSNGGNGGLGGFEDCTPPWVGGNGGLVANDASLTNRIYLGGGGGASTSSAAGNISYGGAGGGIVIIITDTLISHGNKIKVDGTNGGTPSILAGSGGGGAGGSIVLSLNSYGQDTIKFSALGGKGGDNPGTFGEGGGGGGGLLWVSTPLGPKDKSYLSGGLNGESQVTSALPGNIGFVRPNFKANLNGFLFNLISSSFNKDTVDYVCSNMFPPKIIGTIAVGGVGPYVYHWQKSYTRNFTVPIDLITSPDAVSFTPTDKESSTVWFRRIVTDASASVITDNGVTLKFIVQQAITGNNIGKDTTICSGQNPLPIGSIPVNSSPSNGNGIYRYKWLQNNTNPPVWDTLQVASGSVINAKSYDPPSLTQSIYYKRYVQSGRCVDFSSAVNITVLNSITGNITVKTDSVICEGFKFLLLGASAPGQGDGVNYFYQWQDSTESTLWNSASGSNVGATYDPDTSKYSIALHNRFYRRVVTSGPHSVCKSISRPILLTRYPKIKNNIIPANPADLNICSGSVPVALPGSAPVDGAGAGSYSFVWQQSTDGTSFTDASGTNNASTGIYQPPKLSDNIWYHRIVNSGVYKTAVVCTNTSSSVKIKVDQPVLNNIISLPSGIIDTIICNNQKPKNLVGLVAQGGTGTYSYQWKLSTDKTIFTDISGETFVNYSPPFLTTSTYYRRVVISGACSSKSDSISINVLPLIANNTISGNAKVCSTRIPDVITGAALSGGSGQYNYLWQQSTDGGIQWTAAAGTSDVSSYQAPALTIPTKYRRIVTSGLSNCCSDVSNEFDIGIDPLPSSTVNAGNDTIIFSIDKIYHLDALKLSVQGETGTWSILDNGTSKIDNINSYNSKVSDLTIGKNSFLWTVSKGNCDITDQVSIELLKNFIPQGFSPNGDAWNNTFIIEGLDPDDNYLDLRIVNGAGTEVFSTSNRNGQEFSSWDGKNSKGLDLAEGTYYYMLKVTPKDGTAAPPLKSGFIILKRY